ncbi:hypothetical protein BDP55DRAFT_725586 [Colletotrichum godetiae]|uniref:BTB domain-containing protein n=1 Tax=Colletotrichum godetiae TaxID=1209918 RepID=A0AAJ0F1E1_9PEZI|nr:uncharacterized protein BDP55DRAFT_725586 [Colletotrichum godetiae]KAK1689412.1 hypothetical protein BDP55DRAFT_725586 [Colletotrichum godetiae]
MADPDDLRIAVGIPLPADVDDDFLALRPSTPDPDELVTLKSNEEVFTFSKSTLIKDSDYFRACLNNSTLVEGRTSIIKFYNIESELLEAYLCIVDITAAGESIDIEEFLASSNGPMHVELSQCLLEYLQKGAVTKEDKSSSESIKWLFNIYKNAYNTLDSSISDEADLQFQIVATCCLRTDMDETYALARISSESDAFLVAMFRAATQRVNTLLKQTKSLGAKVKRLEREIRILIDPRDSEAHRDELANYVRDGYDSFDGYTDSYLDAWFVAHGGPSNFQLPIAIINIMPVRHLSRTSKQTNGILRIHDA